MQPRDRAGRRFDGRRQHAQGVGRRLGLQRIRAGEQQVALHAHDGRGQGLAAALCLGVGGVAAALQGIAAGATSQRGAVGVTEHEHERESVVGDRAFEQRDRFRRREWAGCSQQQHVGRRESQQGRHVGAGIGADQDRAHVLAGAGRALRRRWRRLAGGAGAHVLGVAGLAVGECCERRQFRLRRVRRRAGGGCVGNDRRLARRGMLGAAAGAATDPDEQAEHGAADGGERHGVGTFVAASAATEAGAMPRRCRPCPGGERRPHRRGASGAAGYRPPSPAPTRPARIDPRWPFTTSSCKTSIRWSSASPATPATACN
ncbi:MAG: hypothetical protein ACK5AL_17110 [Planctomycetota bacterium]